MSQSNPTIETPDLVNPINQQHQNQQPTETNERTQSGDESSDSDSDSDSDSEASNAEQRSKCCMCNATEAKYKCPSCIRRTCSLDCCKQHKPRFECTGKRPRSNFMQSVRNMDGEMLLQDYYLMEDAARFVGGANRGVNHKRAKSQRLTVRTKKLVAAAVSRGIELKILPSVFEKHETNTSLYDDRAKCIRWTVKWKFPLAEAQYLEQRMDGNLPLRDHLNKFVGKSSENVIRRQRLEPYVRKGTSSLEHLQVQLEEEGKAANNTNICVCDLDRGIDAALDGQTIFEHPVFRVALKDDKYWSSTPTPTPSTSTATTSTETSLTETPTVSTETSTPTTSAETPSTSTETPTPSTSAETPSTSIETPPTSSTETPSASTKTPVLTETPTTSSTETPTTDTVIATTSTGETPAL